MPINTSTVVLLVILGFLIYVFANSSTECFSDINTVATDDTKSLMQKLSDDSQKLLESAKSLVNTDTLTVPATQQTNLSSVAPTSELPASQQMPALPTNDKAQNVFNYSAHDEDLLSGAELDQAFERPIPTGTNPDAVDINKNNVDKYDVSLYLPKENNSDWFDTDFSQAKYNLDNDKLINTDRYVIGVNTVGQSLKNASYDIRGTIPNPKFTVSPWNNSTYEPDYNIKPMC